MSVPQTIKVDNIEYVRKDSLSEFKPVGPEVIIRTYSAGVHIGTLVKREGREVTLGGARRLHSWSGALSLNEVATRGVTRSKSCISAPVSTILLLEAIEVIPVSEGVDLSPTAK